MTPVLDAGPRLGSDFKRRSQLNDLLIDAVVGARFNTLRVDMSKLYSPQERKTAESDLQHVLREGVFVHSKARPTHMDLSDLANVQVRFPMGALQRDRNYFSLSRAGMDGFYRDNLLGRVSEDLAAATVEKSPRRRWLSLPRRSLSISLPDAPLAQHNKRYARAVVDAMREAIREVVKQAGVKEGKLDVQYNKNGRFFEIQGPRRSINRLRNHALKQAAKNQK
jgi:hypothetical protein